jgi:hypothetical protein
VALNAEETAKRLAELDKTLNAQHQRLDQVTEEARVLREALALAKADFKAAKLRGQGLAKRNSNPRNPLSRA